jgi:tripartite ATP-independent transporter DctP family solute receptor
MAPRAAAIGLLIFLAVATGCGREAGATVLKLAHGLDPSHPVHRAMTFLAERARERSGGRLRIDVHPSGELGSQRECLELLQIGSLALTKVSSSALETFVPSLRVLGLPYLFRDEEHLFAVLEGEIGRKLLLDGERYWLRGLCFYDAGARSFYTKERPILVPDDLVGMKIRTQESPMAMRMVKALGGSPTPIAWGELYTALQQGVVDGAENNPPSFHLSRHFEVCRYYSLDEHTAVPDVVLVSTHAWRRLSPELREILQEAADASAKLERELWREATRASLEAVREAGVEIVRPDKTLFAERAAATYEAFRSDPEMLELIESIRAVPGS